MSERVVGVLTEMGLPTRDLNELPSSPCRFPDGAHYRVEIPSTEGLEAFEAVLDEGSKLDVPIHRVSQGSGLMMTTDAELRRWVRRAAEANVELSLFARPNAAWGPSAAAMSESGGVFAPTSRGQNQLMAGVADIVRAAEAGIRSVLIGDIGLLRVFGELRASGVLPNDMQAKVSVMLPAANAASAQLFAELGASTLNLPSDLDLAQIAAIRSVIDIPIDLYIESPSDLGGFVRLEEIAEIIRVAAPVYIKFGLRNGPDIYPSGRHLQRVALDMSRERVRRARLGLEMLGRSGFNATTSALAAEGLAVPVPNVPTDHLSGEVRS